MDAKKALRETLALPPRQEVRIMPGLSVRRTVGGIPVVRLHYDAHPERNSEQHPEWKKMERDTYMSAVEAKEFGLIDEVVTERGPAPDAAKASA